MIAQKICQTRNSVEAMSDFLAPTAELRRGWRLCHNLAANEVVRGSDQSCDVCAGLSDIVYLGVYRQTWTERIAQRVKVHYKKLFFKTSIINTILSC